MNATTITATHTYSRAQVIQHALDLLECEVREAPPLDSPQAVRDYLRLKLGDRPHEVFAVMFLDSQHRVIDTVELFRGTLTQTAVYPREVLVEALQREAAAVILCHNHPSGVATPSQNDIRLTQTLKEVLALVDVRVLDHFIVTRCQVLSMAEQGLV